MPSSDLSQIRGKLPATWAQYLAHFSGGEVAASNTREYGKTCLYKTK
jgi:GMP synthase (glutamine-hydrolysing)